MNRIISVYSRNAYKEFAIPHEKSMDYTLLLSRKVFELAESVRVKIEIVSSRVYIDRSDAYTVEGLDEADQRLLLENQAKVYLKSKSGAKFLLIMTERNDTLDSFSKYDVSGEREIVIGRGPSSDICYDSMGFVSKAHAVMESKDGRNWIIRNESKNGIYVNSDRVKTEMPLKYGDCINIIGLRLIALGNILAVSEGANVNTLKRISAAASAGAAGQSSETGTADAAGQFTGAASADVADTANAACQSDGAAAARPFIPGTAPDLTESAHGIIKIEQPVLGVPGWKDSYKDYLERKENEIRSAAEKTKLYLEEAFPSSEDYLAEAIKSSSKTGSPINASQAETVNPAGLVGHALPFWHRKPGDSDLLKVRIGSGDITNPCEIDFDEEKLYLTDKKLAEKARTLFGKYETIENAPHILDLAGKNAYAATFGGNAYAATAGRAAAAAPTERVTPAAPCGRNALQQMTDILIQLTAHVAPEHLKTACLFDRETDEDADWECVRWLPHIWSDDASMRYYAEDREHAGEVLFRLSRILLSREGMPQSEIDKAQRYVIFVSDRELISGSIFEKYVKQDKYLGFTVIYPEAGTGRDAAAKASAATGNNAAAETSAAAATDAPRSTLEAIDTDALNRYVRCLAGIKRDDSHGLAIIPEFVPLLELIGAGQNWNLGAGQIGNIGAGQTGNIGAGQTGSIRERWEKHKTYDHIKGIIGTGQGGITRTLDLHERYNGPHVLVAGTTGAGKSELLKTLVLGLAAEYSPDKLTFILVDFKGGGMAGTLEDLPHIAGLVTNLSGGEIERAILALRSEVIDRQRTLSSYGISHVDDYERLYENSETDKPMPHIIVVIDEFAELRKEKPEMMQELISIAETGRSLGIHLLLATQRPYGNVDDNIRSNVRTNICLRVQDKRDSIDVIGRPDAAYLTGAGRGYMKVGEDEIFEPFQTAYSGRGRVSSEQNHAGMILLTPDGRADITGNYKKGAESEMVSQLDVIKAQIIKAAKAEGKKAESLWLPPLEEEITLDEPAGADALPVIGMVDDPEERRQYPLAIDLSRSGNVAVTGMPSSGKTSLLYTLLAGLEKSDAEISILDLDSGMLGDFDGSENVRACVTEKDEMAVEDFVDGIAEEIEQRKSDGAPHKTHVAVIDSFEDFHDIAGYRCEKKLAEAMREAPGAGVTFVIAGGGFGLGQITGNVEKSIKTVFCLQQRTIYDYMDALHTRNVRMIPEPDIKGRGLTVTDGKVLEFQTALTERKDV